MSIKHFASAAVIAFAVAPVVRAQTITIDGTRDAAYGAALQLQTNNTGFGDNTNTDGNTANGNELDAAYAVVQNGYLNVLLTGNVATDFTHLNVFIADGRSGQTTLNLSTAGGGGGNALANMNGSKFSPGFVGTYALDINGGNTPTTWFANRWDLTQSTAPGSFIGQFNPTKGAQSEFINGAVHSGVLASFDNSNTAGVNGNTGTTTLGADPAAVTTGFELAIPLSQLGSPHGSLKVMVDINGSGDGFLSNQFLPGLPPGSGNLGGSAGKSSFDFSGTANMFFTVNIPAGSNIDGVWAATGGGNFIDSANWVSGRVPTAAGDSATFGSSITSSATINLNGNRTLGQIAFNNGVNSYTIAAGTGGTLTIDDTNDAGGVNPVIATAAGNHTISAPVVIASGVTFNTAETTTLRMTGNISGNAGGSVPVLKSGGGLLVLSGNNSYAGPTQVLSGTAELDSNTAASTGEIQLGDVTADGLPAAINLGTAGLNITNTITTNIDLATASNLRTISSSVAGNNALSGTINVNGGVVFSAAAGGTLTVAGVVQDGTDTNSSARRDMHIAGAGTVILLGAETNTGDTFVDSGTFVLAGAASLSGGSLNVFTGATALISGTLPSTEKIYSQGTIRFRGNSTAFPRVVGLATITIDNGGLMIVDQSASTANPVFVDAGAIEFIGSPSNGQIDLTNNQMRTTNDQSTVQQQLLFANIITSSTGGTLGYRDTGDGHTQIQFALPGDADLNGMVNSADFNALATNFNQTGKFWIDGDINYDGTVNLLDFNALAINYGKTLSSPALGTLVPEPAAIALAVASFLVARRRRV